MFDVYQLDQVEPGTLEAEEALERYQEALLKQFAKSPEGQAILQRDPDMGFWAAQLILFGYIYLGVTLPRMEVKDVVEIVTDLFPAKLSLFSPEEAEGAIPELIAFWEYLKRTYQLPNAEAILQFLRDLSPTEFREMMFDPSRFSMAKSFVMLGHELGFDVTSEEGLDEFMNFYNTNMLDELGELPELELPEIDTGGGMTGSKKRRRVDAVKKKRRKMAKAARKRNRKKRRK